MVETETTITEQLSDYPSVYKNQQLGRHRIHTLRYSWTWKTCAGWIIKEEEIKKNIPE